MATRRTRDAAPGHDARNRAPARGVTPKSMACQWRSCRGWPDAHVHSSASGDCYNPLTKRSMLHISCISPLPRTEAAAALRLLGVVSLLLLGRWRPLATRSPGALSRAVVSQIRGLRGALIRQFVASPIAWKPDEAEEHTLLVVAVVVLHIDPRLAPGSRTDLGNAAAEPAVDRGIRVLVLTPERMRVGFRRQEARLDPITHDPATRLATRSNLFRRTGRRLCFLLLLFVLLLLLVLLRRWRVWLAMRTFVVAAVVGDVGLLVATFVRCSNRRHDKFPLRLDCVALPLHLGAHLIRHAAPHEDRVRVLSPLARPKRDNVTASSRADDDVGHRWRFVRRPLDQRKIAECRRSSVGKWLDVFRPHAGLLVTVVVVQQCAEALAVHGRAAHMRQDGRKGREAGATHAWGAMCLGNGIQRQGGAHRLLLHTHYFGDPTPFRSAPSHDRQRRNEPHAEVRCEPPAPPPPSSRPRDGCAPPPVQLSQSVPASPSSPVWALPAPMRSSWLVRPSPATSPWLRGPRPAPRGEELPVFAARPRPAWPQAAPTYRAVRGTLMATEHCGLHLHRTAPPPCTSRDPD
eukprot:3426238-Prymnesium_polylepis.1